MSDSAQQDGLQKAVVERATAEGGIWEQTWAWLELNWLHIMSGAPSIALTIFMTEFFKPWAKLWAAKKFGESYSDSIENLIVRSVSLLCAFVCVAVLDFTTSWNTMTGMRLAWHQGMLVGTFMTWGLALSTVWGMEYLKVAETARVRFQRLTGVSREDIDAAKTVQRETAITPEMIAADRKARGLDSDSDG